MAIGNVAMGYTALVLLMATNSNRKNYKNVILSTVTSPECQCDAE